MFYAGNFSDGYVFTSEAVFKHQGAFACVPQRPVICDKCLSRSVFHAHGRYQRGLTTLKAAHPTSVTVWRHRWLCLCCGRTMSNGTPDVLAYVPNCTLVVLALLWCYLHGSGGLHNSIGYPLDQTASPRTLARYVKRAKSVCTRTQQAIRRVLMEVKEPRPWDEAFAHGLPPPQRLLRHSSAVPTHILWRALAMLVITAGKLGIPLCLLMARATTRTEITRFLL